MKALILLATSIVVSLLAQVAHGALILEAKIGNSWVPVVAVKDGKVLYQDGNRTVPVPGKTAWRLQGALRDNTSSIGWSPVYSIRVNQEMDQGRQLVGTIIVKHDLSSTFVQHGPSPFLKIWPKGLLHEGLLVAAWVVDGEVGQIEVSAMPATTSKDASFVQSYKFILSPRESAGQPIVLLWTHGEFVAPAPCFKDSHAQNAFEAMLVNDEARFLSELTEVENVNKPDEIAKATLLHFAAEAGLVGAIDALVLRKVKLDAKVADSDERPLHWAAAKGRLAAVQRLLELKTESFPVDKEGCTPLFKAVAAGHYETAAELADHGGINIENSTGVTALMESINNNRDDIARLLLSKNAKRDFIRDQLEKTLITKIRNGSAAVVELLIELGANANCEQEEMCPLIAAARAGSRTMADVLLKHKAAVNKTDKDGMTALMRATVADNSAFAEALLENGAEVGCQDKQGRTGLHLAAYNNAAKCTELLLARGADLTIRDNRKCTPFEAALCVGSLDVVNLLLKKGASVSADSPALSIALQGVLRSDRSDILKAMLENGCPLGTKLDDWPLIRVAEIFKAIGCIQVLKGFGVETREGASPAIATARGLDAAPTILNNPMPFDPREEALQISEETVLADMIIDDKGRVLFPKIAQSNDARLSRAVLEALPSWRFSPPLKAGKPTLVKVRIPVRFSASAIQANNNQVDEMPKAIKRESPLFPKQPTGYMGDAQKEIPGIVIIEFTIDKQGCTKDFRVVKTSGSQFSDAAIEAMRRWTYSPAKLKGQPVEYRLQQQFNYTLTP